MTLHSFLIHNCDIQSPAHALVGQKKATAWDTADRTDIECRIVPSGDIANFSIMGRAAIENAQGFFQAGTTINVGDKVTWKDPTTDQVFLVEGVQEHPMSDPFTDQFVSAALTRQRVNE